tara:strand:+ start:1003 stop:2010 length:1008 start_codon:yes stop_codon:yes gene_type:complete
MPNIPTATPVTSFDDFSKNTQDIKRHRVLFYALEEVLYGLFISAIGATLGFAGRITGYPALIFFIMDLAFLFLFYRAIQQKEIHQARSWFWALCGTLGYSLAPLLLLVHIASGPTVILGIVAMTALIVGAVSTAALAYLKTNDMSWTQFLPFISSSLLGLIVLGFLVPFAGNVPAAVLTYSLISAVTFSGILFLDILKCVYFDSICGDDKSSQRLAGLRSAVGIYLDIINIFKDLLTAWYILSNKENHQDIDLSQMFQTLLGLVIPVCFLTYLCFRGWSASNHQVPSTNPQPATSDILQARAEVVQNQHSEIPIAQARVVDEIQRYHPHQGIDVR